MASKELVQKAYDCFATGDMDTFRTLYHVDVVVKTNGMHKFSGTYNGLDNWMNNMVMHVPSHFENFKIETKLMIAEGDYVFALGHATADGMDADFGHLFKVESEKITEFHILDDSQKWAATMKAL